MHKVGAQDTDGPSLAADAPNTADVAPNALVADLLTPARIVLGGFLDPVEMNGTCV